jgi:hypothetical protein
LSYILKGIVPARWVFQGAERLSLLEIGLYTSVDETHIYLERRPCVLEAVALPHCFPVRTELFPKEYIVQIIVLKMEKASFVPSWPIQLSLRNTYIFEKKSIYVRSSSM